MVVEVVVDDPAAAEIVADLLFASGASAVSELDAGSGRTAVVADLLPDAVRELMGAGHDVRLLAVDPEWTAAWQAHAGVVEVGEQLAIRPDWVDADGTDAGRTEVVLDAANAFGSGSHATTRLCLAAMEDLVAELPAGSSVLDVGCGTGVLGVAALLLGAGSLVAVDIEPDAVAATRRTAGLNDVSDRLVEVSDRSVAMVVEEHGPFDLVLANLLIPIVEDLGTDLVAALAPGGSLVVSGLLADDIHVDGAVGDPGVRGQVRRATHALGADVEIVRTLESEGWAALVARSFV